MSSNRIREGANATGGTQPREGPPDSGSLYLTELPIATLQGQSQVVVARSPGRLPYVSVFSVGFLMAFGGVAVAIYTMHLDGAVVALFHRAMSALWPASESTGAVHGVTTAIGSHLAYGERRVLLTQTRCETDACVWAENYIRGKLNWSVNPCSDFYGHVCSHHWMARDLDLQSRIYREMTVGVLIRDIEKFFRSYMKDNQERYQEYPGVLFHETISLLTRCQADEKDDKNLASMRALLEAYNLDNWPYSKAPSNAVVAEISASVDRDFGVFPFAKVFLQKLFPDDSGYTIHIDAPSLTLKRYNLAYGVESPNFTAIVALSLSLFGERQDVTMQAEAITRLENRFHELMSLPYAVKFQDRIMRVEELHGTADWDWDEYLKILLEGTDKLDNNTLIAILNYKYISNLALEINGTDTATLLNYVGYRLLVQMSPLFSKAASPLLQLSHDYYLKFVPARKQACVHLLERLYKHGMHFIARMALGKNLPFLFNKDNNGMPDLKDQLMSSVTGRLISSASWMEHPTTGIAVNKINDLRLVFLDSKDDVNTIGTYYNVSTQTRDMSQLVERFRELQAGTMNVYWKAKPQNEDLDARYDHTALATGHEYYFGLNLLFLPLANIAFLSNITKAIDPVLLPLIMAEVFRGMFAVVDRRGAAVHHKLAVVTWWSDNEVKKFSELEHCFQVQYNAEISDMIGDGVNSHVKMAENIADNAALGPLHDMYVKLLASQDGADRLKISVDNRQLDMGQLFFVLYAVGLCDNPNEDLWARKLKFGETPGRLRVNIPLMNFATFSAVFGCPAGTPMNPARKCILW